MMSLAEKIQEAKQGLLNSLTEGIEECRRGKDFDRHKVSKAMFAAAGALTYLAYQQRKSEENLLEELAREAVDRFFGKKNEKVDEDSPVT